MRFDPRSSVLLDTYEPLLADAVVAVLRRHGVPARTEPFGGGEVAVHVPGDARDEALVTLSARMEEVHAALDNSPQLVRSRGLGTPRSALEDEPGPPIVMERIRRLGFLAALLVPLLIITLAAPGMPLSIALVVFVGGLVVVSALRARSENEQRGS